MSLFCVTIDDGLNKYVWCIDECKCWYEEQSICSTALSPVACLVVVFFLEEMVFGLCNSR